MNDITVLHAHTGASVRVNRHYFLSLDELKRFCTVQLNIPLQQLFLLSSFGLKLKSSTIEHADEVYVFDKNLFSIDDVQSIQRYIFSHYTETFDNLIHPIPSPLLDIDLDRLAASKNSRQLIGLLTTNLGWVAAIESDSRLFLKKSTEIKEKLHVLFKSLKVANLYIENYCTEVKKSYDASFEFLVSLQKQTLGLKWKENYQQLQSIKTLEQKPLSDLLDATSLQNQASECVKLNEHLNKELVSQRTRIATSNNTRAKVDQELDSLEAETIKIIETGEPDEWLRELQILSNKVKNDTNHLLEQSKHSMDDLSIDVIVDTFLLHKSEFVTKIYALSLSLHQVFTSYKDLFTKLQVSLSSFLQQLSQAQAEMVILRESLKSVSEDIERLQEVESHLAHTVDLPLLYGLYIVEGIRRTEWMKSLKSQAAKTNENFATLREKEIKTRSNWINNYGDILKLLRKESSDFNSESLVSFDLNISDSNIRQEQVFSFEDANSYIKQLQDQNCNADVINALLKSLNDIPSKMAKISSSQDSPQTESRDAVLKGYKGRIKKLENLLHQEQFKNFQQWPSSSERLSIASRYSINEKLMNSTSRPDGSLRVSSMPTLQDSGELSKLTEENRTLTNDLKRHKNTVEMLNEELKLARHESSTKDFETRTLKNDIEKIKEEHESAISRLQIKISEQEVAKALVEGRLATIEEEVSHHATRAMEKDKLIGELKSEHKDALGALEEQLSTKVTEMDALKEVHEKTLNSEDDVDALKAELAELKKRLEEKDTALKATETVASEKSKLMDEHTSALNELAELKSHLDEKDAALKTSETSLDEKNKLIDEKIIILKEKDQIIEDLTNKHTVASDEHRSINTVLESEKSKLNNHLETMKENYERLSSMKNDLLENMSNRENEFAKEKVLHQEEIESLKMKLEEMEKLETTKNDEIIQLTESQRSQTHTIVQLVVIINSLIIKSRDLSDILVIFYDQLCSSLRSMGLLAVRSSDAGGTSIIRVKGLKKATGDLSATVDLANGLKPDLEQEVYKLASWPELPNAKLLEMGTTGEDGGSGGGASSESLDAIVEMLVETYNLTSFEEKYLKFVGSVTNLNDSYLSSVSKRFKEVEHLAKKELKENRKLKELVDKKISVRDFQVGDLVLFLPTSRSNGNGYQWAAFNDMGDAKFMLKDEMNVNASQRQWFIGRILNIEEVDNQVFMVSTEEVTVK